MTGTEVTLEEIIAETGGIKEISSDTHFYIENLLGEGEEADVAQVTSGANIFKYVQSQMPKIHTLTKVIIISGDTDIFDVDLIPYIYCIKLHLKFPSARSSTNITINITGLKNRKVPLESITMSGLDENKDFLPKSKRGVITFTLDSTDYEFPESIYHFGGFMTGKVYIDSENNVRPNYIFLHIDYLENNEDMNPAHIYSIDNGIYSENSQNTCEVWNQDSTGTNIVSLDVASTTLILKNNGVIESFIENQLYQSFLLDFFSHIMHQYMPIIVPTGNVVLAHSSSSPNSMFNTINPITAKLKNDSMFSLSTTRMPVSPPSEDHAEIHGVVCFCQNMVNNVLKDDYLSILSSDLKDSKNWAYLPTEYGLYRVIVKGKYLEMQLNK